MGFFDTIGNVISSVAKFAIPIVSDISSGGIGGLAKDIFGQLAKSVFSDGKSGGLFSDNLSLFGQQLPNPLKSLNGLLAGVGGTFDSVGGFLNGIGDFLQGGRQVDGQSVTLPDLGARAEHVATAVGNVAKQVSSGQYDTAIQTPRGSAPPSPADTGGGTISNTGVDTSLFRDGELSKDQTDALAGLDPNSKEYKRTVAQFKLQNHAETMAFISNYFKMLHDTQMSIIQNMR